ncbi:tRNA-binding protein [Entomoplasma freundtii]|uniref:Uncharacterized protein n=1 Tax=Entomoplasma freundtii TaxID=74700 RepID=A0A2K8NRH1_9MOLU|nr:hypothetical protein [Entomoplasma freundtii]ATZ16442.1 hypothetical protein EFREU_v1c04160 [Entomoplasma freundtii]TDY55972.1 tRNA-binding protein [Entomoplasma freundtii]
MDKKYGIFYNHQFDVFMVALKATSKIDQFEVKGNITFLKSANDIVGINLFPHEDAPKPEMSFCSEEPTIVNYIQKELEPWIQLRQETQFVIGKILETEAIPKTHLQLCKVDIKADKPLNIICGAPNARPGLIGVVATCGTWMPNSQIIAPKSMMGFETNGMLCSTSELNLTNHHFNKKGIIDLPNVYHHKIGTSFWEDYYGKRTKLPV